ncbi:molybdopterin biosynthesis protein MoeB [Advenella kashmirensis W13003]|uniref:Molybdopterin biosynthesis protein MoeB n=1 Tax=Advenella kashmirensis W13003 TaxID=1424334 RepID=V8QVD5_9BURK|nr:HesA/MoeB/ThiF family protein [Advenella kashmirensis]ETF03318.1 molybdopterin biosynthesis protein MoeB [Advenella kashmirensis W13003]
MDDSQLLRYARHLMLDAIGIEGQEKLLASSVLILGLGGLGSPAAAYLASAGIGRLVLVDDDLVELSNLQRQIIHTTDRIGQSKAESARTAIAQMNPDCQVETVVERVDTARLAALLAQVDLIVDCTDNFRTRQAINEVCVAQSKPFVSAAAIRFSGQVTVFDTRHADSPCYACAFPPSDDLRVDDCATMGVFAPLVGMIGSTEAAEAIKTLLGIGDNLQGRLMMLDALSMQWHTLQLERNPDCPVCSAR